MQFFTKTVNVDKMMSDWEHPSFVVAGEQEEVAIDVDWIATDDSACIRPVYANKSTDLM